MMPVLSTCRGLGRRAGLFWLLAGLLLVPALAAERLPVAEELERLAAVHGFQVTGIQETEDAMGRVASAELVPRLRTLLKGFDYVMILATPGRVERVIILGEKVPFEPPSLVIEDSPAVASPDGDIVLATQRQGTGHRVEVSLEGAGGKRVTRSLLIDTGADAVVLPISTAAELGLAPHRFEEREMQTANGKIRARIGTLPGLWIGGQRIAGVQVAFLTDGKLGNEGLLGMSVLGRYTLTIDDQANRLILSTKNSPSPPNAAGNTPDGSPPEPGGSPPGPGPGNTPSPGNTPTP